MIVGSVEYEVVAHLDQRRVQSEIDRQLNPIASRAGERFGTFMGRAIGAPLAALSGHAGRDAGERAGRQAGIGFGGMFRRVLAGGAVLLALHEVSDQFKKGFAELSAGEAGAAQLEAALQSTGAVAGITAEQLQQLAKSIQDKTGADDDAVVHAEGMLLTFTKVRDVVGQGNDVFSQATRLARDLSVRGFGDLDSSAVQLGKALNDPLRGVTALSRAGIQFTAGQKRTIEELIRSNDVLGAQKLILAEVTAQVGGSGEAFGKTLPGQVDIAKERFANLRGELVGKLAPAMVTGLGFVNKALDGLPGAFERMRPVTTFFVDLWRKEFPPILEAAKSLFHSVSDAIDRNRDRFEAFGRVLGVIAPEIGKGVGKALEGIGKLLGWLIDGISRVGIAMVGWLQTSLNVTGAILGAVGTLVSGALSMFDNLLGATAWVADALGLDGVADGLRDARANVDDFMAGVIGSLESGQAYVGDLGERIGMALAGGVKRGLLLQADSDPALKSALDTLLGGPEGVGLSKSELDKHLNNAHSAGASIKDEFLRGIGGTGSAADGSGLIDDYDKQLAEAQKAAADRARALGEAVTEGIRAHVAKVKGEVSALEKERDKILDFRASVLGAAASFTKLSSLLDDPSNATAARIEKSIENRLLGLRTFAKNLQTLRDRHLDRGVLAELAQGGPEQRGLASALVRGSDAQLRAIGAAERAVRQQDSLIAQKATDTEFGAGAIAKNQRSLDEQNRRLAAIEKQLAAQPALIGKAVAAAEKNAKVTTKTAARTAVT